MKSLVVTFTGPRTVELREQEVRDPGPGEILVRTVVSLVSTGTEGLCLEGDFDLDSRWASATRYPQTPGYSNVGRVLEVGKGVAGLAEGDRVFTTSTHRQFALVAADHPKSAKLPDYTADEDATWSWLAAVTQTGVRRAEHAIGETAAVVGVGPLGQLVVQYLRLAGLQLDNEIPRSLVSLASIRKGALIDQSGVDGRSLGILVLGDLPGFWRALGDDGKVAL